MHLLLLLLGGDARCLVAGEALTNGSRQLGSQVERLVLLVLVEDAQLGALVRVDDGEDAGDGFADIVTADDITYQRSRRLGSLVYRAVESGPTVLMGRGAGGSAYILVSFDDVPPAIFCVRS